MDDPITLFDLFLFFVVGPIAAQTLLLIGYVMTSYTAKTKYRSLLDGICHHLEEADWIDKVLDILFPYRR